MYNAATHKSWTNDYMKDKKITLGSKYKWKPDSNPPVGGYDINTSQTQWQSRSAIIKESSSPPPRPQEYAPSPGEYNAAAHKSWTNDYMKDKKITLGSKYKW